MRKVVNAVVGLALIAGAVFFAKKIIAGKAKPKAKVSKVIKTVFVDTIKNGYVQVTIPTNGNLEAAQRIDIYSEVQGVFKSSKRLFKAGEEYKKGATLVAIDGREYYSSLLSQRSQLYNQITAIMPDLKMDYSTSFQQWENYLKQFDVNKSVVSLPKPVNDQEKFFVNGKNITSLYYTIKNMEERYRKYRISAPFRGVLTEASVTPGSLVRAGQKLGEFINPALYELEVAVNKSYSDLLKIGKEVALTNIDKSKLWTGKVVRVNGKVDLSTQTISVYIAVKGKDLKEGMYLEAQLDTQVIKEAFELNRKLLVDNAQIYTVDDSRLKLIDVTPVYFTKSTVVLQGVKEGSIILSRSVPGAYEDMLVTIEGQAKK